MTLRSVVLLVVAATLCAMPARAQSMPGCGPAKVKFDVVPDTAAAPVPPPDAGKASVVFIENSGDKYGHGAVTTLFGIDGNWIGAAHGESYFNVSVDPGEHHLCSYWQTRFIKLGDPVGTDALHLTAAAGKTYFFLTRFPAAPGGSVRFEPLDSDEAQLLMSTFRRVTSHVKK